MSSRTLNRVTLIGNLGNDPNLRPTPNGGFVCNFTVATDRSWLPRGAMTRKEETQWHEVVVFDKLAEICGKILQKGTKVFLSGRVKNRKYTTTKGESFEKVEILAQQLISLDGRKDGDSFKANKTNDLDFETMKDDSEEYYPDYKGGTSY